MGVVGEDVVSRCSVGFCGIPALLFGRVPRAEKPATTDEERVESEVSEAGDGHDDGKPISYTFRAQSTLSLHSGFEKAKEVAKTAATRIFKVTLAVKLAGSVLAICAGIVNVVAFHALGGFVSHVSGNVSRAAMLTQTGSSSALDFVGVVASFIAGSMVCGLLIAKNTVNIGLALYGIVLMGNSCLLFAATIEAHHHFARYLAAAACGLQNGIATSYSGAVIRTTHVTGIATDIGLLIGRLVGLVVRRRCHSRPFDLIDKADIAQDLNKLQLLSILFFSFALGAYLGSCLYAEMGLDALLVPAAITGLAGLADTGWRIFWLNQKFLSDKEMEGVEVTLTGGADVAIPAKTAAAQSDPRAQVYWHDCEMNEMESKAILNVLTRADSMIMDRSSVLERQLSVVPADR